MFHKILPSLQGLAVDITLIRPYVLNANQGDEEAIAESLTVNGQYRPIVVNAATGEILAGNTTYAAALSLGWTHIAVTDVDVMPEDAARIVLADNRTAQLARMDEGLLLALLESLPDLSGTGYGDGDTRRLEAALDVPLVLGEQKASVRCGFCGK